jgi:hypothetical protein
LPNIWIYNENLSFNIFDFELDSIKKVFNAKRLENALLTIKSELFPYDVEEVTNPHASFKDFYFHHQINAALLDFAARTAKLEIKYKSAVNGDKLQFMLNEAAKEVGAGYAHDQAAASAPAAAYSAGFQG